MSCLAAPTSHPWLVSLPLAPSPCLAVDHTRAAAVGGCLLADGRGRHSEGGEARPLRAKRRHDPDRGRKGNSLAFLVGGQGRSDLSLHAGHDLGWLVFQRAAYGPDLEGAGYRGIEPAPD